MTAHSLDASPRPAWRTQAWGHRRRALDHRDRLRGILAYAFAAFLVPMQRDLGYSAARLTGAFSLAPAASALAGVAVGRRLDRHSPRALMTIGSGAHGESRAHARGV